MRGKNKCKILKQIRQQIAEENDIPLITKECTYQGECSGTCPRCEAELRYLEQQLARRQALGKAVTVAALSVSLMASATACSFSGGDTVGDVPMLTAESSSPEETMSVESIGEVPDPSAECSFPVENEIVELDGDVAYVEETTAGAPTESYTDTDIPGETLNWQDLSLDPDDMIMGALPISEVPNTFPTGSLITEFEDSGEEGAETHG